MQAGVHSLIALVIKNAQFGQETGKSRAIDNLWII
jgi:hypothetical protein